MATTPKELVVLDNRKRILFAKVDKKDYQRLRYYNWYTLHSHNNKIYVVRYQNGNTIFLHSDILQINTQVDHIDNDGLNNQRSNLRAATASQNSMHQGKKSGCYSSTYKGVSWRSNRNCWVARITLEGYTKYIGSFPSEEEAAKAYDIEAVKVFGDFAVLNLGAV